LLDLTFETPVATLGSVSENEIYLAFRTISKNKALGNDLIPDVIFNPEDKAVVKVTTELINYSFSQKHLPAIISESRLLTLNKSLNEIATLENLRPILITSPLKKILEAIILDKLKLKLIGEKIINTAQTGFIPECGTNVNLLKFIGDILDIRDRKGYSGKYYICFIDFKAAFDSVNHTLLYRKLENAGLDQITIDRIKFLFNSNYFTLNKHKGPLNKGVPQGSLISPFSLISTLMILCSQILVNKMYFAMRMT